MKYSIVLKDGNSFTSDYKFYGYTMWDVLDYIVDNTTGVVVWDCDEGYLE